MDSHRASSRFACHFVAKISKLSSALYRLSNYPTDLSSKWYFVDFAYPILDPEDDNSNFAQLWNMLFFNSKTEALNINGNCMSIKMSYEELSYIRNTITALQTGLLDGLYRDDRKAQFSDDVVNLKSVRDLFLSYGFCIDDADDNFIVQWT
jgi:hypothetical protein